MFKAIWAAVFGCAGVLPCLKPNSQKGVRVVVLKEGYNQCTSFLPSPISHPLPFLPSTKIIIIIIIINRFVQCHKVITSEALGPGSVLVSRERRESLGEEECL